MGQNPDAQPAEQAPAAETAPGATPPTVEAAAPPQPLTERQAKWLLVGMTVYVAVLAVLAADQVFELGLVRPELDRDLIRRIESLDAKPGAVPTADLAAVRQAAIQMVGPNQDVRAAAIALAIHDAAYAFDVGSMPDAGHVQGLTQRIEALRQAKPPVQDPAVLGALAKHVETLNRLREGLPEPQRQKLTERWNTTEYIINYHEFSIPHLIRALRGEDKSGRAAATYCLHQIAARFFNYRGSEGGDPERWKDWWRRTEAELERRSRR